MHRLIPAILTVALFVATIVSSVHSHEESDHGDGHECPVCLFANAPAEPIPGNVVVVPVSIVVERLSPVHAQCISIAPYQVPQSRAPPAA